MNWKKIGYGLLAALVVWKVVLPLLSFGLGLVGSGLYATTTAAGLTQPEQSGLKSSIRNVTTDFDQLSLLLQEFFQAKESLADTTCEVSFKDFLQKRAVKSRPALENGLDWLLSLYKVLWPVLVIMLLSRLNSGKAAGSSSRLPAVKSGGALNATAHNGPSTPLPRRRTMPARSMQPRSPQHAGTRDVQHSHVS